MEKTELFGNYPEIQKANKFTTQKLQEVREALSSCLDHSGAKNDITIVTTGSYGRGEASPESDMDWFLFFDSDEVPEDAIPEELELIRETLEKAVPNSEGDTGTFGADAVVRFNEMLQNMGGPHDTNENLTRRMLFILEGTWLYGQERFQKYQSNLLRKYLKEDAPRDQIPRFLLNDIIRYYRTITTDFEHKVSERGKGWGLRKTKLRFSRKLLYFGGIVTVAEMKDLDPNKRRERAIELFSTPVLERVARVSDETEDYHGIFDVYEKFMKETADPETRELLDALPRDNRNKNSKYQQLKQLGAEFSTTLENWLKGRYPSDHPIHHALLF